MKAVAIESLLFDLGGVLIQLSGISSMMRWTNSSKEKMWEKWLASPAVRQFESGKITAEIFSNEIVKELNLPISADEFLDRFAEWPEKVYPGALELIRSLKLEYSLGCLSNTNSLHWNRIFTDEEILQEFDYLFPSHLTGYLKPDLEAFYFAADEMSLPPEKILFLDDNAINVEAAETIGMLAYKVSGIQEASVVLKDSCFL